MTNDFLKRRVAKSVVKKKQSWFDKNTEKIYTFACVMLLVLALYIVIFAPPCRAELLNVSTTEITVNDSGIISTTNNASLLFCNFNDSVCENESLTNKSIISYNFSSEVKKTPSPVFKQEEIRVTKRALLRFVNPAFESNWWLELSPPIYSNWSDKQFSFDGNYNSTNGTRLNHNLGWRILEWEYWERQYNSSVFSALRTQQECIDYNIAKHGTGFLDRKNITGYYGDDERDMRQSNQFFNSPKISMPFNPVEIKTRNQTILRATNCTIWQGVYRKICTKYEVIK